MKKGTLEEQEYLDRCSSFDERYEKFIAELVLMPNGTVEEKEERFFWAKKQNEYDNIVTDLIKVYNPYTYKKIENRFKEKGKGGVKETSEDFDMATHNFKKDVDPLVLLTSLKEVLGTYSGWDSKGERVLFSVCVLNRYRQLAGKEVAKEICTVGGMNVDQLSVDSQVAVSKLLKAIREYYKKSGKREKPEEIIEILLQEMKAHKYTKKEIKAVIALCEGINVCSIYQQAEDGNEQIVDVEIEESGFQHIEGNDMLTAFFSELGDGFDKEWKTLSSYLGKVSLDILKAFITKDLLIALKMEAIPENRKDIKPEPACLQWCNNKKLCRENSENAKRDKYKYRMKKCLGYVRYDVIYENEPYGNDEMYSLLEKASEAIYSKIMHAEYLNAALINENFYDVYSNRLYPHPLSMEIQVDTEKFFDFSDGTLAKVLHKDKGQISNNRRKYDETAREALYRLFCKRM